MIGLEESMPQDTDTQPMPKTKRRYMFIFLLFIFLCSIPALYLYSTGYRFDFVHTSNFVSTGGLFIAAEKTEVAIFIDDELVRELRIFRKAFYAQNIDPGTHRVSVQKEGYHTWVKELPVYPHLVSEVQAFNMPLVPEAIVFGRFETATGSVVIGTSTVLASTTQNFYATSSVATSTYRENGRFMQLKDLFKKEPATTTEALADRVRERVESVSGLSSTSALLRRDAETPKATTTKESGGVRLFERGEDVYAVWVGSREDMPYYYCAEPFERLPEKGTKLPVPETPSSAAVIESDTIDPSLLPAVQQVPENAECTPEIRIDRKWQKIKSFDFYPGSTDWVIMTLEDGVYVVEIDDRSWQNVQPLLVGRGFETRIDGGTVYIYDGTLIYQMILE